MIITISIISLVYLYSWISLDRINSLSFGDTLLLFGVIYIITDIPLG